MEQDAWSVIDIIRAREERKNEKWSSKMIADDLFTACLIPMKRYVNSTTWLESNHQVKYERFDDSARSRSHSPSPLTSVNGRFMASQSNSSATAIALSDGKHDEKSSPVNSGCFFNQRSLGDSPDSVTKAHSTYNA